MILAFSVPKLWVSCQASADLLYLCEYGFPNSKVSEISHGIAN